MKRVLALSAMAALSLAALESVARRARDAGMREGYSLGKEEGWQDASEWWTSPLGHRMLDSLSQARRGMSAAGGDEDPQEDGLTQATLLN